MRPEAWDEDTFYGLIEVFHDLVARPRRCWYHEHDDCGLHFENFDTDAGRRVYRSRINRFLAAAGIELRLADTGEDVGRLVHIVDEARADLLQRALASPERVDREQIEHAIALFRRRGRTEHDKRSAIVTLAGILEKRRQLINDSLYNKDEAALFNIANNFHVRHQNEQQKADYDPVFLDWIFWWYLATIELTDRIQTRGAARSE